MAMESTRAYMIHPLMSILTPSRNYVEIGTAEKSSVRHGSDIVRDSTSLLYQRVSVGYQTASRIAMSINPLSPLSNGYIQSLMAASLGNTNSANSSSTSGVNSSSLLNLLDNNTLSPFAQMLSTLQQLQQSNPTQYQQVTQQISSALQSAAQTAQTDGNTTAANQLNQLATDFTTASQSGQLPNVQDLAQAVAGHHHHHGHGHHHVEASSNSNTSDNSASDTTGTSSQSIDQLFGSQTGTAQTFNPTQIILNTLSNSGLL
jgi:hypothetical protein